MKMTSTKMDVVQTLFEMDPRIGCSDVLFTVLGWLNNFTVGPWKELCHGCAYSDCGWDLRDCATHHFHKKLYHID